MIKLRGGTASLQIEMGRWQGVRQEERAGVQAVRVTRMNCGRCMSLDGGV